MTTEPNQMLTKNRAARGAGGRPTVLTPKVQATILEALRRGNYLETAAALAGVSRSTVFAWLKDGESEAGRPELKAFAEDVRRAQGEAEARMVETIDTAATDDWRAAAWRLERSAPRRWCVKVREVVTAEMNALLEELGKELAPDDHKKALAAAERVSEAQFDVEPAQRPGGSKELLEYMPREDLRAMRDSLRRAENAKAEKAANPHQRGSHGRLLTP